MSAIDDKQVDDQVDRIVNRVTDYVKRPPREGFDNLTREQSRQLLEFFMYRLGGIGRMCDERATLAATLPQAYNAWYGRDVVKVVSVSDPTREWKA